MYDSDSVQGITSIIHNIKNKSEIDPTGADKLLSEVDTLLALNLMVWTCLKICRLRSNKIVEHGFGYEWIRMFPN